MGPVGVSAMASSAMGGAGGSAEAPTLRFWMVGMGEAERDGVPVAAGATRFEVAVSCGAVELDLCALGPDGLPLDGRRLRCLVGEGEGLAPFLAALADALAGMAPR